MLHVFDSEHHHTQTGFRFCVRCSSVPETAKSPPRQARPSRSGKRPMLYRYIAARLLYAVPALFLVSVVAFAIVQLPPGDFFDTYMAAMEAGDANLSQLG